MKKDTLLISPVFLLCIGFSIIHESMTFYTSGSGVIDLTPTNFQNEVINSNEIWIVEFFAPWCGHCQSLVPEYQKAAKSLKGIVKLGAVNADEHKSLAGQYGVSGFPTIKIFGLNKHKPEDYQGSRNSQGFIDAAMKVIKEKISAQSGKKAGSGGTGGGSADDVIELTDSNFDKTVLQSEDMWLVEFFAPWCGHCKNLAPHWQQAASELKGKFKLGALDSTVHTVKASQYEVRGYPTIKFFYKGEVEDYAGGRTASDIIAWANDKLSVNVEPPKVFEAVNQGVLETACKEHPICIIAVLPHILDCQSECRNKYINMLLKLGDKYKQKQWGYVWVDALAQPALEESLDIGGFGYPALAALNAKKMQFALLRGSFSFDGVNEFLRDISFGRGRTAPLKGAKLPILATSTLWDGKDGELPVDDDIDLSDIDLDKDEL